MFERVDVDADRLVGDLVGFLDVGGLGACCLPRLGFFLGGVLPGPARERCGLGDGRGRDFDFGFAEGAFEIVERDFAGTQRAFQHLLHQRALCNGRGCGRNRR